MKPPIKQENNTKSLKIMLPRHSVNSVSIATQVQ